MKICFVGDSHAPKILAAAALVHGFDVIADPSDAELVFISQDTPTDAAGIRDVAPIKSLVEETYAKTQGVIVLTSQVMPGFTRALGLPIFYMAETLRIKDAMDRALEPEQFIVGKGSQCEEIPQALMNYMIAHKKARIHEMTYEDAEFAKIAINSFLAAQVECTNKLATAALVAGAKWKHIAAVLRTDKRIGPYAYLEPGRWQDSRHLLRDSVTLEALLAR